MADAIKLYNPNDGLTGRTGGPYLDEVQAKEAEVRRAVVENREPNLDGIEPYAGIQLVPAATLLNTINVNNTPSEDGKFSLAEAVDTSKYGAKSVAEVVLDDDSDETTSGSVTDDSSSSDSTSGRRRAS